MKNSYKQIEYDKNKTDYSLLCKKFKTAIFTEDYIDFISSYLSNLTYELDIPSPPTIKLSEDVSYKRFLNGNYNFEKNEIFSDNISCPSCLYELLDTLTHEMFHSYQRQKIYLKNCEDKLFIAPPYKVIDGMIYKNNLYDYDVSEYCIYYTSEVEQEARKFAIKYTTKFLNICKLLVSQKTEFNKQDKKFNKIIDCFVKCINNKYKKQQTELHFNFNELKHFENSTIYIVKKNIDELISKIDCYENFAMLKDLPPMLELHCNPDISKWFVSFCFKSKDVDIIKSCFNNYSVTIDEKDLFNYFSFLRDKKIISNEFDANILPDFFFVWDETYIQNKFEKFLDKNSNKTELIVDK